MGELARIVAQFGRGLWCVAVVLVACATAIIWLPFLLIYWAGSSGQEDGRC